VLCDNARPVDTGMGAAKMRAVLFVFALASLLVAAQPARAADPEDMAREGVQRLMEALELLIERLPQYERPIINEHGDIIIRRKRPEHPDDQPDERPKQPPRGGEQTPA